MRLECIKSVRMNGEEKSDRYQAFKKGNEYIAIKEMCKGLGDKPYVKVPVLRARNEKGESHIIKMLENDSLDVFFDTHFREIR